MNDYHLLFLLAVVSVTFSDVAGVFLYIFYLPLEIAVRSARDLRRQSRSFSLLRADNKTRKSIKIKETYEKSEELQLRMCPSRFLSGAPRYRDRDVLQEICSGLIGKKYIARLSPCSR